MKRFFSLDFLKSMDVISALTMQSQTHSLLESLFIYSYSLHYYGYLLLTQNKNIIAIDCGDYSTTKRHVEKLIADTGASFDYLLLSHLHPGHCQGAIDWLKVHPDLTVVGGARKHGVNRTVNDGEILQIGDLCLYFMLTPGHSEADVSYLVTQVTPTSTKTPLLFSGDVLSCGGAGTAADFNQLLSSLNTLKNLPNETLVFPGHEATATNLAFAKMLEPENPFVSKKLDWVKSRRGKINVGSLMAEERLYNPFLRLSLPYFQKITGETDSEKVLAKLLKLRQQILQ